MKTLRLFTVALLACLFVSLSTSDAGPLLDRWKEKRGKRPVIQQPIVSLPGNSYVITGGCANGQCPVIKK